MSSLKSLQFPRSLPILRRTTPPNRRRRRGILSFGASDGSSSNSPDPSGGDARKQELLARIAMLQAQKVRLSDFLDERSAYLTQFAEDANVEFEQIGDEALKELDQASARIMDKLDARMQAFEETAAESKLEIERNDKILEEFEEKVERDRNEGLFFQSLGSTKKPLTEAKKQAAKMEARKLKELEKEKAGSKTRKAVYVALMAILGVAVADAALNSSAVDWRKLAAFGCLFLALLAQFVYELRLSSNGDDDKRTMQKK